MKIAEKKQPRVGIIPQERRVDLTSSIVRITRLDVTIPVSGQLRVDERMLNPLGILRKGR